MEIPQIRLESTPAKIGIETRDAVVQMEQPQAELDIQQIPTEMTIDRKPSKLTIDQTLAWEAMNLKSLAKRMEEFADDGMKAAAEGTARRVQEGNELMKIENRGNPIEDHAKKNATRPEKQFNIGFIPPHFSVKINYEPADLSIDWEIGKVINNTKRNKPVFQYDPYDVNIYLRQKNSLEIDFVNVKF